MNSFIEKYLKKLESLLNVEISNNIEFFNKPLELKTIFSTAELALVSLMNNNKFVPNDISKKNINDNKITKQIYSSSLNKSFNDLDDICNINNIANLEIPDKNSTQSIPINITQDTINMYQKLCNELSSLFSYYLLAKYITIQAIDLFKSEFPSIFRINFLKKLIAETYNVALLDLQLKLNLPNLDNLNLDNLVNFNYLRNEYSEIKGLLNDLNSLNTILTTISIGSLLYKQNKEKLFIASSSSLNIISKDVTCEDLEQPNMYENIDTSIFEITLSCPIEDSEDFIEHQPLIDKINNFSCEIESEDDTLSVGVKNEISSETYAIIKLEANDIKINQTLTINSTVNSFTSLASLNEKNVYSPIKGIIEDISTNTLYIKNISDDTIEYVNSLIENLSSLYTNLNELSQFIGNYSIYATYPTMLAKSILNATNATNYTGVNEKYEEIIKNFDILKEEYGDAIKKITDKDNVELEAKNENLSSIKNSIDRIEELKLLSIQRLYLLSDKYAKETKVKQSEFMLFDFYVSLISMLGENLSSLESEYKEILLKNIRNRTFLEKIDKREIENRLTEIVKKLERGFSRQYDFTDIMKAYRIKNDINDVKSYLENLAKDNRSLDEDESKSIITKALFLFDLYLNYRGISVELARELTSMPIDRLIVREGNEFIAFLDRIFLSIKTTQSEIDEILLKLESIETLPTYNIIPYKDGFARYYALLNKQCNKPKSNSLLEDSGKKYNDIDYWIKYCSYATLASVANPAYGWSTGWIVPSAILFPVIYLPIKPIELSFGTIVIGLSICGAWIFPWVFLANLSGEYNIPLADPTKAIKDEIYALKDGLINSIKDFKLSSLRPELEQLSNLISNNNKISNQFSNELKALRLKKPTVTYDGKINIDFKTQENDWKQSIDDIKEKKYNVDLQTYELSKKHKAIKSILDDTGNLNNSEEFKTEKDKINNIISSLEKTIDKLDDLKKSLPISLKPNSVAFNITLKNPTPIIEVTDEIDDNVNESLLSNKLQSYKLDNSKLMKSNFIPKEDFKILDTNSYLNNINDILLVKTDVLPKYENLNITNLAWMNFLYNDFVKVGAKTYGFPGFPPI